MLQHRTNNLLAVVQSSPGLQVFLTKPTRFALLRWSSLGATNGPEHLQKGLRTEGAYSITSSARARNVGGTSSPIALALFKLSIRSMAMIETFDRVARVPRVRSHHQSHLKGHLDGTMGISRLLLPWALLRVVVCSRLAAAQARVQSRLEDGLPEWKAAGPVHRDHGFLNGACIWSRYEE
jgi:hypothetical protein